MRSQQKGLGAELIRQITDRLGTENDTNVEPTIRLRQYSGIRRMRVGLEKPLERFTSASDLFFGRPN